MKRPVTEGSLRKLTPIELGQLRDTELSAEEWDALFVELSHRFCGNRNAFLRQMWGLSS